MDHPEPITFATEIDLLMARKPFVRFTIVMGSGNEYLVGDRDEVSGRQNGCLLHPGIWRSAVARSTADLGVDR